MDFLGTYLDHIVFGTLSLMSVLMLALVIERILFFRGLQVADYGHSQELFVSTTANLTTISSIASNAPYIGLLGTVVGILLTFHQMGSAGEVDAKQVMVGLALALKATAAGLLVAIPAMAFYNGLMRKVDEAQALYEAFHDREGS
ncbi:MAG: biopolymer transport protein ExbB [Bacteroidia bacterium]